MLPFLKDNEKSTLHHYKRGSKYNQENLSWTFKAVRNSCDNDLQTFLDAKILKYNPSERFGPISYYQLVHHIITVDPKTIRAITQEITNVKVTEQEGESIAIICKLIR
jgi:dipeptidase